MQIIPVIDLKGGLVVHATGGNRSNYRPVHQASRLCRSSAITEVLASFLSLHPFKTFYIADLDAICGDGNHDRAIAELVRQYPALEFWVDTGSDLQTLSDKTPSNYKPVLGTESQSTPINLTSADLILSLDFKHNQALGHPDWLQQPDYWPATVVLMTLDLVGSNNGPDFQTLAKLCDQHPDKQIVAAGGVRDIKDLQQLRQIGVQAVLLASALHNGCIDTDALQKF